MDKQVRIVKVVTRNIISDFFAKIQNTFGVNLTSYERMLDKGTAEIQEQLNKDEIEMEWYRYEISQLTNGAIAILFYGDKK